jgi:hypothetical protein
LLNDKSGSVLGDSTVFSWAGCHSRGTLEKEEEEEEEGEEEEEERRHQGRR